MATNYLFQGGVQTNVVPNELVAVFDIRLAPDVDHVDFESRIKKWCKEAGDDVFYTFEEKNDYVANTKLDDTNPFWLAFKDTTDKLGLKLKIAIFPGGTDSRYVRSVSQ